MKESVLTAFVLAASQISSTGALPISTQDGRLVSLQSFGKDGSIVAAPGPADGATATVNSCNTHDTGSILTMDPSCMSNEAPDVPAEETKEHQCPTNWAELVQLANRPGSAMIDIKSGNVTIASFLFDEGEIPGLLQALCAREEGTPLATRDEPTPTEIMLNHALQKLDIILNNQIKQAHISDHNTKFVQGGFYAIAGVGSVALLILIPQYYGEAMAKALSKLKRHVVDCSTYFKRRQQDSRTARSMNVAMQNMEARNMYASA
jgi:hypothetical protein